MDVVAKDSLNDVISTAVVIVAIIGSHFTDLPLDGIGGVVVAAFILQTFMLLVYLLVTKLSSQSIFSDLSIEVNRVFEINIPNIVYKTSIVE